MTVKRLKEILAEMDEDKSVGLSVYGHNNYMTGENVGYEPLWVREVTLSFSTGKKDIVLLSDPFFNGHADGYRPVVKKVWGREHRPEFSRIDRGESGSENRRLRAEMPKPSDTQTKNPPDPADLVKRIEFLESALITCWAAAVPQAQPWPNNNRTEQADYIAKVLPGNLRGINRLLSETSEKLSLRNRQFAETLRELER